MANRLLTRSAGMLARAMRVAVVPALNAIAPLSVLGSMAGRRLASSEHKCNLRDESVLAPIPKKAPYTVVKRVQHSANVVELVIQAPHVAQFCEAGQFVVVRVDERGERIPLTIADFDREKGTITLVIQNVGYSSSKICAMAENAEFKDFLGPLGHASEITKTGKVVMVSGGLGIAPVFPIQRALQKAGNEVFSIMGAKSKDLLFWEDRMGSTCDHLTVCTDDGTKGRKGFVTDALKEILEKHKDVTKVIAIGPAIMMYNVEKLTKQYNVPTVVSLNTIMVDGTGMCGGCRVKVGKDTKFVCVDGPEFDAHQVDWKLMLARMGTYKDMEKVTGKFEDEDEPAGPRTAAYRTPMPCQDAHFRATNFEEVALGFTPEMAIAEANRCLQCGNSPCRTGCPVNVDIKRFIGEVQEGKFANAVAVIKETHEYPAICGRVCPQEVQCESKCKLMEEGQPITIGRLERFVADWAAAHPEEKASGVKPAKKAKKNAKGKEPFDMNAYKSKVAGKKVAIIGAGPSGLSCSAILAKLGAKVSVFEALPSPGGVLIYGIPEFRLPKSVVRREALAVEKLGVDFRFNYPVGNAGSVPQLLANGFDAVFIGTGAGLPNFLGVPGDDCSGVYSSNEFLTRVNLMKAYKYPEYQTPVLKAKSVAVFGGGNVAMDSARCAKRLGAKDVYICYRRTMKEMPARIEELHHALEEGIHVKELVAPVRILADEKNQVKGIELKQMELGAVDAKGKRAPVAKKGAENVVLPVDQIIVAIGNGPNPMLTKKWPELKLNERGNIPVDENQMTNIPGVFAGGDIVTGAATVIRAMGAGRLAAQGIVKYLAEKK